MEDNNIIVEINKNEEDTLYDDDKIVTASINNKNEEVIKIKKPKRKINKKKLLIVLGIVISIILISGIIIYFIFFNKKTLKPEEETEKIELIKDNYKYEDGILLILDESSKEIGKYTCIDKDPNKCYVASYTSENLYDIPSYVDEDGKPLLRTSKVYNNKFVFIKDNDLIILYNILENKNEAEYKEIKPYDNNIVVTVNKDDKYGIIEINDSIENILEYKYNYLAIINDTENVIYNDGTYSYIIDYSGKTLSNKIKNNIKNFNEIYIVVKDDKYSLIDYSGTKLLSNYEYINLYEGFIIAINDNQMYLYDQDLNKLNEKGISIKVDDYNVKYIFDKNNDLKKINKPYTIAYEGGTVNVETSNGLVSKQINMYEVEINKNYNFVSYLDGVIYFYKNVDKTELLGKYNCSNKNNVTSASDNYSNCFVATNSSILNNYDETLYTPILNNKYVFINDTMYPDKKVINLFNITSEQNKTNNPTKNEYQAVDIKESSNNTSISNNSNSLIVAKNSSGYLGMLSLDESGLKSIIKFTDKDNGGATKNIQVFKDYYIVTRDMNYLYTKDGDFIATPTTYEIVDYIKSKLIVKSDYYMIYSDGKIISDDLVYVSILDNYFIGINKENKLNVYDYNNKKLLSTSLDIKNKDYKNSYKIIENKNSYGIVSGYTITIDEIEYNYNYDWSVIENEEE